MHELIDTPTTTKKPPFPPFGNYFQAGGDEDSAWVITQRLDITRQPRLIEWDPDSTTLLEQPKHKMYFYDLTPIEREIQATETHQSNLESEEAEATNIDRIKLLARKYARKGLSIRDEARLVIATERIRWLIPRVTTEDFEHLADTAEEIKKIDEADIKLREELGLNDE